MFVQSEITAGPVRLRSWTDDDVRAAVDGHDEVIAGGFEQNRAPSVVEHRLLVAEWRAAQQAGRMVAAYVLDVDGVAVGNVEVTPIDNQTGSLSWTLWAGQRGRGYATRAVKLLIAVCLGEPQFGGMGFRRVEAQIHPDNERSRALALRCGLRLEGSAPAEGTQEGTHLSYTLGHGSRGQGPPLSSGTSSDLSPRERAEGIVI